MNREAKGWETPNEDGNKEETPSVYAHIENRYEDSMINEEKKNPHYHH